MGPGARENPKRNDPRQLEDDKHHGRQGGPAARAGAARLSLYHAHTRRGSLEKPYGEANSSPR